MEEYEIQEFVETSRLIKFFFKKNYPVMIKK